MLWSSKGLGNSRPIRNSRAKMRRRALGRTRGPWKAGTRRGWRDDVGGEGGGIRIGAGLTVGRGGDDRVSRVDVLDGWNREHPRSTEDDGSERRG